MDKSIYFAATNRCIALMRDEFDSHDLIHLFAHTNSALYATLLEGKGSVHEAHKQFGKFLINNSTELGIKKVEEVESPNLYGDPTPCAKWKKIKQ